MCNKIIFLEMSLAIVQENRREVSFFFRFHQPEISAQTTDQELNVSLNSLEEKHFLYVVKKLTQQEKINTKETLYNYPLQFTN